MEDVELWSESATYKILIEWPLCWKKIASIQTYMQKEPTKLDNLLENKMVP